MTQHINAKRVSAAESLYGMFSTKQIAQLLGVSSYEQVGKLLGIKGNTLKNYANAGSYPLPSFAIGKRLFYTPEQVRKILALRKVRAEIRERYSVLDESQMEEVRRLYFIEGWAQVDIATQFNVTQPDVSRICSGRGNRPRNKRRNLSAMFSKSPDAPV